MKNQIWIEFDGFSFSYNSSETLINNLNFSVGAGDWLEIRGDNGSGKSTLLAQIESVLAGEFHKGTKRATHRPFKFEVLPQHLVPRHAWPILLSDVLRSVHSNSAYAAWLTQEQLQQCWNESSGGEKKRAYLAEIFARDPDILLLDEPMNDLDQASKKLFLQELRRWGSAKERLLITVAHEELGLDDYFRKVPVWLNRG